MRLCNRLRSFAFASIAIAVVIVFETTGTAAQDEIRNKLRQETKFLSGQNYRRTGPEIIEQLAPNQRWSVPVHLVTGVANAIVAVCGHGCGHVEIALHDYQRNLLTRSNQKEAVAIINGNPQYSGLHEVEVAVPGCRALSCAVGLVVLRQEQAIADVTPSPALPPTSKESSPPESAQPKPERRTGTAFDGRWTGEWGGRSSATILISGGKVLRYRFRGRKVPITRATTSGNTIAFGSETYTVRVTFESARLASAHYRHHTKGTTSTATLTKQWPR